MGNEEPVWDIQCTGLKKSYGGAIALDGADFSARYGEVHALLGENGAGKSTLVRILTGAIQPDAGQIHVDGQPLTLDSVRDGIAHGTGAVFQELSLMPDLTVAENVLFRREPRRFGLVDRRAGLQIVRDLFAELGIEGIHPAAKLSSLPISAQQVLEIAKVVARKPKILILDEATAALTREASLWLFDLLRQLTAKGTAVLFISHRINEAFEIADRITVFRNGRTVSTGATKDYTEAALVEDMLGRKLAESYMEAPPTPQDDSALEVSNLSFGRRLHDVSFSVRKGEILGLGGLQGQGQYDLLLALYGWHRAQGEVRLAGTSLHVGSPKEALAHGVVLVPEDRRTEGLMMAQSIRENLTLPILNRLASLGWIPPKREQTEASRVAERFSIKAPSLEYEVQTLSGGNQQKVLVGKLLSVDVKVLLLADVTRGIDVGTRADMYALIHELAANGVAIIMYSSDSSELVRLCHRVAVMFDRTISAILEGSALSEENLLRAAVGLSISGTDAT